MPQPFERLGFLSSEVEQWRDEHRGRLQALFENIEQGSKTAIAEVHAARGTATLAYVVGTAFWLRAIEACQGAVLLSERGLATSSYAVLRTALECLFSACALWRKPEIVGDINAWHHQERIKQAREMLRCGAEQRVLPERLSVLKAIAAEMPTSSKWSFWEAAQVAGLEFEYAAMYRGLGIAGAHATPRSLDSFHDEHDDGTMRLRHAPDFAKLDWLLSLVGDCLRMGIERHQEALKSIES